jgi:hypothetical protein
LYAVNLCESRPSGTRLSASAGASWKRSAVRALSLRLSDDRSGADGSMHQAMWVGVGDAAVLLYRTRCFCIAKRFLEHHASRVAVADKKMRGARERPRAGAYICKTDTVHVIGHDVYLRITGDWLFPSHSQRMFITRIRGRLQSWHSTGIFVNTEGLPRPRHAIDGELGEQRYLTSYSKFVMWT